MCIWLLLQCSSDDKFFLMIKCKLSYQDTNRAGGDIIISNQFLITRALHFAKLRQAYYQASVTITLGRRV